MMKAKDIKGIKKNTFYVASYVREDYEGKK